MVPPSIPTLPISHRVVPIGTDLDQAQTSGIPIRGQITSTKNPPGFLLNVVVDADMAVDEDIAQSLDHQHDNVHVHRSVFKSGTNSSQDMEMPRPKSMVAR
jgi:hypothetical protein